MLISQKLKSMIIGKRKIKQDNIIKYRQHLDKVNQTRRTYLKNRMEALNDGIIAIIITIMVLEIPLPSNQTLTSYYNFLGNLSVFLVTFFIVANFWYELNKILATVVALDKKIVVIDFAFLAALSLLPILTKWMMHNPGRLAVMNYGIAYLIVNLLKTWLAHTQLIDLSHNSSNSINRLVMNRIIYGRTLFIVLFNLILIGLAFLFPNWILYAYLALPIIDFLFPNDEINFKN